MPCTKRIDVFFPSSVFRCQSSRISVRRAKTEAKASLRADVTKATVRDTSERLAALRAAEDDVKEAGHIAELVTEESAEFGVDVELADAPS